MAAAEAAANQRAAQAAALVLANQNRAVSPFFVKKMGIWSDDLLFAVFQGSPVEIFTDAHREFLPRVYSRVGNATHFVEAHWVSVPAAISTGLPSIPEKAAVRAELVKRGLGARVANYENWLASRASSGGFFGGLVGGFVDTWKSVAVPIQHQLESNLKVAVQVATLGDKKAADSIIKSTQDAARNPVVQMVAATALTVYTGGLAGAALAEGMGVAAGSLAAVGTSAAGTFVASAAVGKAQDKPFNLQKALQAAAVSAVPAVGNWGVKEGANWIGGSQAGALVETGAARFAVNAGMSAVASGVVSKVTTGHFNLQDAALAGVAAAAKADEFTKPAMQVYTGVKALVDLKDAVDKAKASKDATAAQKAKVDSQLAALNAENARMEAVKAEIAAMEAKLKASKPADQVPIKTPVVTSSQPVALAASPVAKPAPDNKIAALTLGLGLLKLLA